MVYDYSTSSDPLVDQILERFEKTELVEAEKSEGGVMKTPAKEASDIVRFPDKQKWANYCKEKKGTVHQEEFEGKAFDVCFINDGKDGIRCQTELFYKLKCGVGKPVTEIGKTVIHRNTDPNSNVHSVVVSENREGMAFMTKTVDGKKYPDAVVIRGNDGTEGLMKINDYGLPGTFTFNGTIVNFSNYTETTVDLTITKPDGTKETLTRTLDSSKFQAVIYNWFFPSANASTIDEDRITSETLYDAFDAALPPDVKLLKLGIGLAVDEFCKNEEFDCFLKEMPDFGTSMSVIGCGIGLGSILFTGGASSPLAYLGCAQLATRFATIDSEIGPCKGDLLNCGMGAILDTIQEEGFDYLPGFLSEGFRVKGTLKNSATKALIGVGTISAKSKGIKEDIRGEWNKGAAYEVYFQNGGAYTVTFKAQGFEDASYDISMSSGKIQITNGADVFEMPVGGKDYLDIPYNFELDPDAYITGEVIDAVEGESIENAVVTIKTSGGKSLGSDRTVDDGTFLVKPTIEPTPLNITISVTAKGYESGSVTSPFTYAIKDYTDEYIVGSWDGMIRLTPSEEEAEEEDEEIVNTVFVGTKTASFSRPNTQTHSEQGMTISVTETTSGTIAITFNEDGSATCTTAMNTSFTTTFAGNSSTGSGSANSTRCTGSIDQITGVFVLSGSLDATIDAAGQKVSADGPFNVVGSIEKGKMTGSIAIPSNPDIDFEEK